MPIDSAQAEKQTVLDGLFSSEVNKSLCDFDSGLGLPLPKQKQIKSCISLYT